VNISPFECFTGSYTFKFHNEAILTLTLSRTAEAIGRKINLMLSETKAMVAQRRGKPIEEIGENEFKAVVVHGEKVDSLTDAEWDNIFWKDEIIFARTSPKHKLEIVRRAQSMGHMYAPTFILPQLKVSGVAMHYTDPEII
jgi:hypothetical protein